MTSTAASKPRLRFAPSPTGYLHIGGVRTALFNWLWAKKTGGVFILRIEDTDRERSTPENEAIIVRDMKWLGLDWSEGPDVGGPFGPYRQMERLPIYAEFVEKLIAKRAAYRCTCTKEELDAQREALKKQDPKAQFRYPGTCKNRTGPAPNRPFVIRMNAPTSGAVTYNDLVFGEVTTPNTTLQDAVIMRSDGVPLYNLGAVVDDITMGITLVARGRDHMINTPIQILLYQALGADVPQFAHLPMMLNKKGEKLSKRDGAVAVGEYRDMGVPAQALLNYLVRFGWSFGDEEIFSIPDLIQKFDWERCGRGDGRFDQDKYKATVFEHLKRTDLISDDRYIDGVLPFLEERDLHATADGVRRVLPLIRERGQTWVEAADMMDYFFRAEPTFDDKAKKKFLLPEKAPLLRDAADLFESAEPFQAKPLEERFHTFIESRGIALKDIAQAMRVALTGRSASPGLFEVMEALGRDRTVERLSRAAAIAEASAGQ
jgi:glutamyl-tRNA synthetase